MFGIGMTEILILFFIALVVFGASRLPEIGKSLGKGIKEFKKAGREITGEIEETIDDEGKKKEKK